MDIAAVTKKVIEETLGIDEGVVPTKKLADLGVDAVDAMDIVISIEDELGIEVPFSEEIELLDQDATVQTAIDIFTKLSKKS
jgi:acyl carrier protein